jgi:hypothetical protein
MGLVYCSMHPVESFTWFSTVLIHAVCSSHPIRAYYYGARRVPPSLPATPLLPPAPAVTASQQLGLAQPTRPHTRPRPTQERQRLRYGLFQWSAMDAPVCLSD